MADERPRRVSSFKEVFADDLYARKGYVVCRIVDEQEVVGRCHEDGTEQDIWIPAGTVAIVVQHKDTTPRWYLPQITPPGHLVGDTGKTFAEVYEAEGFDSLELLLPYTGRPDNDEGDGTNG